MFDTYKIARDFSAAAQRYDKNSALQQQVLQRLLSKIDKNISTEKYILDAGCGTGQLGRILSGNQITQLDIAFGMCQKAKSNLQEVVNADLLQLPFANAAFDIVFSSLALQWVPDTSKALAELRRVLKKGGILAVSSFGSQTLHELRASFASVSLHHTVSAFGDMDKHQTSETIVQYFPDVMAIMQHLKAIGANNKMQQRGRGLMTKSRLNAIENYYDTHFAINETYPVTWEVTYLVEEQ